MKKDKPVHIDPKAKPDRDYEKGQNETTKANMEIQEAFYDEDRNKGVDPANLNNQSAILPEED